MQPTPWEFHLCFMQSTCLSQVWVSTFPKLLQIMSPCCCDIVIVLSGTNDVMLVCSPSMLDMEYGMDSAVGKWQNYCNIELCGQLSGLTASSDGQLIILSWNRGSGTGGASEAVFHSLVSAKAQTISPVPLLSWSSSTEWYGEWQSDTVGLISICCSSSLMAFVIQRELWGD